MSYIPTGSFLQQGPSNPTGTTSTGGVMMGLAGSITPNTSGRVMITVTCDFTNNVAADGLQVSIRIGTGSAPANGAAVPGGTLTAGSTKRILGRVDTASKTLPFTGGGILLLTIGTTYWIDLLISAITGGTGTVTNVNISAIEI